MNNFNGLPQSGTVVIHNISGIVVVLPIGEPIPHIPKDLIDKIQQATYNQEKPTSNK